MCCEGVAAAAYLTLDYLKTRRQFGYSARSLSIVFVIS
jgi:hypothetical protein